MLYIVEILFVLSVDPCKYIFFFELRVQFLNKSSLCRVIKQRISVQDK